MTSQPAPAPQYVKASGSQLGVTAAFLVIAVLIAAKHAGGVASAISWLKAPAKKATA